MALGEQQLLDSLTPSSMDTTPAVHFDPHSFDALIEEQGMKFVHFRNMPCPLGRSDRHDVRKAHDDHAGCSNGFLYQYAGEVTGVSSGNTRNKSLIDVGMVNSSSMQVTLARHYSNKPDEEIVVAPFDRFYLKDNNATVVTAQLFEANASGMDRMQYPVVSVEHLIDSDGKSYEYLKDFSIYKGQIKWLGGNRPGVDATTSKGQICSIRYRYIPYWWVDKLLHEIRLIKAYNEKSQQIETKRMPYSILLQRENFSEGTERQDPNNNNDSPRQSVAPRQGSFGPR